MRREDFDWGREQGWTVVQAEECWHRSLAPLMERVRDTMGDAPVYLSFDIDSLDPGFRARHGYRRDLAACPRGRRWRSCAAAPG